MLTNTLTVRGLLGPGGITNEVREPQIRMAELVDDAFARRIPGLVEAGTGTGKSLGYLVPAALSGSVTIVATGTKALQEQLVNKDLPWLAAQLEPMGIRLTYGLAKGRQNYVSLRRLRVAVDRARQLRIDGDLDPNHQHLKTLAEHAARGIGDEAKLPPIPADVWRKVRSDADDCLGKNCPNYDRCFFYGARRSLADVQIVVANHALLAADIALDNPDTGTPGGVVLPDTDQVVVDEAHHIRDSIFSAFTKTISTGQAKRLVDGIDDDVAGFADSRQAHELVKAEDRLLAPLAQMMKGEQSVGLPSAPRDDVMNYLAALGRVANVLPDEEWVGKIRNRIARLQETAEALLNPAGSVVWVETTKQGIALNQGPVDVAPILRDRLYRGRTVVFTSATLTSSDRDFGFARQTLGLPAGIIEGQFDSPFDYPRQCLMYLPNHLPAPSKDYPIHDDTIKEMWRLIHGTRGRAFLLFASKSSMLTAWDKPTKTGVPFGVWLEQQGYPARKQGDASVPELVDWFKSTPGAVLFALASFWEGVSIEGDALSLVVIEKIPFPAPTDPVFKAREQQIEAGGGDPFRQLSLPQAILRLKQGVGRLVRTQTDRGIVAILDPRVQTARYGRQILRAMPPVTVTKTFPTDTQFSRFTA